MGSLDWKKSYEIGIKSVDQQHQHFLELINRISEELKQTKDIEEMTFLIDELNAYAGFHFISEENVMRKVGYTNLDVHKAKHDDLKSQLDSKEWVMRFVKSEKTVQEFIQFLFDWFLNHTVTEDKQITAHINRL